MALQFPTFPGAGGGGGAPASDQGFKRGWQYMDMASATYVPASHQDGQGNWYNKVTSAADNGTQWEVGIHNDQWSSNHTGNAFLTKRIGHGDYWWWDLPDGLGFNKTNKMIFRLDLVDYTVANKNDMVIVGLAAVGNGSQLHDAALGRGCAGGFANDSALSGAPNVGLLQPDIMYGMVSGAGTPSQSPANNASNGEVSTVIVEVVWHSDKVLTTTVSSYRPSPTGGAAKLNQSYTRTGILQCSDLKMFVQVGRTAGSNSLSGVHFKPMYLASTEKDELDWGV